MRQPWLGWAAAGAAIVIVIAVLHAILLPFVAGFALAYLVNPAVDRLEQLGLNRALAAAASIALFAASTGGVMALAIPVFSSEVTNLIQNIPQYIASFQTFVADPKHEWMRKIIGEDFSAATHSAIQLAGIAADWVPSLMRSFWSNTKALLSLFALFVAAPIVGFYISKDWNRFVDEAAHLLPAEQRENARALAREIDGTIRGFLHGQGAICLILALFYALALRVAGVNHGILIGLVSGLMNFIPYLGSLAGIVLSLSMVILQPNGTWLLAGVILAIFAAGQTMADYALSPVFVARRLRLNPVEVMFAIAAFGYLFGFVGLLLAVPLAATIGVVLRFAAQQRRVRAAAARQAAAPAPAVFTHEAARKSWLKILLGK